jgi:hypothetical protein
MHQEVFGLLGLLDLEVWAAEFVLHYRLITNMELPNSTNVVPES